MNLDEVIMASIAEFLDVEVHRDTETLDLSSKIEIVRKRLGDKLKNTAGRTFTRNGSMSYEYEMFFSSNPNDMIKIDGWIPIQTDKIDKYDKIPEYIEIGLLRKIGVSHS
ncbi:hypothetical protein U6A24_09415 [Aquimarina gracilis]|uniref:Uncharacterized protein n=1 Tax=Aquimarina gracilis TaxID=874422 RepID=A0ABU5ZVA0_9FLAO|nr:hypothetical protein [Aquimarina gracilis]MEB3345678.1 hypothetical protein [Aquimarina gracilis]